MIENSAEQDWLAIEADAPARVDFTGGFTDVPPLVDGNPATHVSAAIDRRVHARVAREPGDPAEGWRLASDLGFRRVVAAAGAAPDTVVSLRSDVPFGAGLGSSGAAAVAIVAAVRGWAGHRDATPGEIARAAVEAERAGGRLGGSQDQYAAAYGSVRRYVFHSRRCESATQLAAEDLDGALMVVRAGGSRRSSTVVQEVVDAYRRGRPATCRAVARLHCLAPQVAVAVERGEIAELADVLDQVLGAQLDLHPLIVGRSLLRFIDLIRPIEQTGAKLLGAGGGRGALLIACREEARRKVAEASSRAGCLTLGVRFAPHGVAVRRVESVLA